MTDHLHSARDYLALGENQTGEQRAETINLAVAHALVGILDHLKTEPLALPRTMDEIAAGVEIIAPEDIPARERQCVLCLRKGSRWFEESRVGLICTHAAKCADRREALTD